MEDKLGVFEAVRVSMAPLHAAQCVLPTIQQCLLIPKLLTHRIIHLSSRLGSPPISKSATHEAFQPGCGGPMENVAEEWPDFRTAQVLDQNGCFQSKNYKSETN